MSKFNTNVDLASYEVLHQALIDVADAIDQTAEHQLYVERNNPRLTPEGAELVRQYHQQVAELVRGLVLRAAKIDRKLIKLTAEINDLDGDEVLSDYEVTYPDMLEAK